MGPEEQNCSTEGQNRSSEVSQGLIRGRLFSGHSGALRTKTNLQVGLSLFYPVAKGRDFDVGLFYKSQIFFVLETSREAIESSNFPIRHGKISICLDSRKKFTRWLWRLYIFIINQRLDFQCCLKHSAFLGKEYHLR